MFLLIDNYDSFTYNLYHYFLELGADVSVVRNDEISAQEALDQKAEGIILSPGPCTPDSAGICLELIEKAAGQVPIMGVCLGHQAIGQHYGGKIIGAPKVMHGKVSAITHTAKGVFKELPSPYDATRYHSLVVDRKTFPDCLEITAESADGVIMGLQHRSAPVYGVQFHPESIASDHGHALLKNFMDLC